VSLTDYTAHHWSEYDGVHRLGVTGHQRILTGKGEVRSSVWGWLWRVWGCWPQGLLADGVAPTLEDAREAAVSAWDARPENPHCSRCQRRAA